jgi:hypothetical protein
MSHTYFSTIARDAHTGTIERLAGKRSLGKRGIEGVAGATCEYRVVSVEPDAVMGWGDATAIGRVEMLIDGRAEGEPVLALLS